MKLKNLLLIGLAFTVGPWLTWCGVRDFRNSQHLAAEGKSATAKVLDQSVGFRSRGGNRYYLGVQFQTEAGQSVLQRVQVSHETYSAASPGGKVALRYLPAQPSICAVGAPVSTWWGNWLSGGFLLGCGVALVILRGGGLTGRQAAQKVVHHVEALCESHYEYAPVNASEFKHLDLAWYQSSQHWLETQGFAILGDEENLTFRRTSKGNRTLLRTMVGRDGTWLAYLYHFKPAGLARAVSAHGFRILELQTQFANGSFLCTSNAEAAGKLDSPPGVDALRLPHSTGLETILNAHAQRVAGFFTAHPGVAAVRLGTLEDVHRVQNVLQEIKAAYRRNVGITREELQRMAGSRLAPEQIEALHADVEKLRAEQNRRAA